MPRLWLLDRARAKRSASSSARSSGGTRSRLRYINRKVVPLVAGLGSRIKVDLPSCKRRSRTAAADFSGGAEPHHQPSARSWVNSSHSSHGGRHQQSAPAVVDLGRRSIPVRPRRRAGRIPGSDSNPLMPYRSFFLGTFCSARFEVKVNSLRYRRSNHCLRQALGPRTVVIQSITLSGAQFGITRTEGTRDSGSLSGNPVGRRRLNCRPCFSRPVNHRLPGRIPSRCPMAPRDFHDVASRGAYPVPAPPTVSSVRGSPAAVAGSGSGAGQTASGHKRLKGQPCRARRSAACSSVSAMALRGSPRSLIRSLIRMAFRRYFGS